MAIASLRDDEQQRKTMRTSFVFIAAFAAATFSVGVHAQETPRPDTGDLPSNGGAVIDKTRPGSPTGTKASSPKATTAASSPASAASGVLRKRPAASAPR
jgi:hypothetical protein